MKTALHAKPCVHLLLSIGLLCLFAPGCKKRAPEPSGAPAAPEQLAGEQQSMPDPDVIACELEDTTIGEMDLPEQHYPAFVRRMKKANRDRLKQGQITLAKRPFTILLGDNTEQEFFLFDVEKGFGPYWWGSWSLHSYHKIDETYYQFASVEEGARLTARLYRGPLGVLKLGKGGRPLEKAEFRGSLKQAGAVAVPVGTIEKRWPEVVTECALPAGDYTPCFLQVAYDNLYICVSNNYHTNAQGQAAREKQTVYGIAIREDQPYVLDFSTKPVVVFDEPGKDKTTFRRGEEITFAAVLVDPKLDIMIRGLDDTSVKVEKETSDGRKRTQSKSLDPNVIITRADGAVVAEGIMPFG